jgi:predicted permease
VSAWRQIRRVLRLSTVERDVDDEIRFHLESRINDLERSGHAPHDARRIAEREFGDVSAARAELAAVDRKRQSREVRAARLEDLAHDIRFSVRSLLHARGVSAMIVVLLALGVGANAATIGVADELFIRQPDGVVDPQALHRLFLRTKESVGHVTVIQPKFSFAEYRGIVSAAGTRAAFAGYTHPDSIDAHVGGERSFVQVSYATPSYLPLLGIRFARGRTFTEAEGRMGAAARLAVISYDLWQARFGGSDGAIGTAIEVAGERFTIIGVAQRDFTGVDLDRADLWLPYATMPVSSEANWYEGWRMNVELRILARLTPAVSADALAATATVARRRGSAQFDACCSDSTATIVAGPILESLGPSITPSAEQAITPRLIGVAVIVLIVACANVANLLLLRGLRRRREIAVRLALGISKRRLFRQVLLESVLLSLVAALVATVVAMVGASLLRTMILPTVHWATTAWNPRLVLAAVPIALATGVVAGIAPAFAAFDADVASALKDASRTGTMSRSPLRVGLIVLQGALSVVLLIGAGLFIRSFDAVRSIDVGYDLDDVSYSVVEYRDSVAHYLDYFTGEHSVEIDAGLRVAAARLALSPNVETVALSQVGTPMSGYLMAPFYDQNRQPIRRVSNRDPARYIVSPEYFAASGMRLARGRFFTKDDAGAVTVINETAARAVWPGEDPIGKCVIIGRATSECSTVLGVVRDTHTGRFIEPQIMAAFSPLRAAHARSIVVRGRPGRGTQAMEDMRREIQRALPKAEPPYVSSMVAEREPELRPWRLGAMLFGVFGALALLVATVGVYSVMAFSVKQRTRELGVRIALGARAVDIERLIVAQAVWPVIVGVIVGIALALASGRLIANMLFGVTVADPTVIGSVAGVLILTAVLGGSLPGWRATKVSPVEALRAE